MILKISRLLVRLSFCQIIRFWTVQYSTDGIASIPTPVKECELFVGYKAALNPKYLDSRELILTHVHFVTLSGFKNLLTRIINESSDLDFWEGAGP